MIYILAHRGFWTKLSEQNTDVAFERALANGFGIETDLRDYDESIVVSHDMPNHSSMDFEDFLRICKRYDSRLPLALNVKADGLQQILMCSKIANNHFYFDMSVPDMLGYIRHNMKLYSRYSEIEPAPALYERTCGIWLDNFVDERLNLESLERFLRDGKEVVLVSPELHKREYMHYWQALKRYLIQNPQWSNKIGLCTDFPSKARDYFNEK